jgi:hypothetical protein
MKARALRLRQRARRIIYDLAGRSHYRVVDMLLCQIDEARSGAELAMSVASGVLPSARGRAQMGEIEHAGDGYRGELVVELSAALTTPIDREDLFRLSRSVDDVLDNLRDYVRETDLFAVPAAPDSVPALAAVEEGLAQLRLAVAALPSGPRGVAELALAARKSSGRVRAFYQFALADLLVGPVGAETLKRRELLRRVDVIGLRLGECADALADAMLKRSM